MQRPYVFTALFYSVVFVFAFAALGNLGLITRERTLLLPFLFIVLAFPMAQPGEDPVPVAAPKAAGARRSCTRPGRACPSTSRRSRGGDTSWRRPWREWAAEERPYTDGSGWSAAEWHTSS